MIRILYLLIVSISILSFNGCSSDKASNTDNISSHTSYTIDLSLFGVHLGEPIDSLVSHIPNLRKVPYDSINNLKYHLPYDTEEAQVFKDLEITLYSSDTVFIVNHKNYEHRQNGSPIQFPLEKTTHHAKLCFMIKNNKVLQGELLVTHPIEGYDNIDLSIYNFVGAIKKMYNDKYQEPDSVLMYNKETDQAAFIGYSADEIFKNVVFDELGGTFVNNKVHEEDVWVWANAKIYADWDFLPYKNGKPWWWVMCHAIRIRYVDIETINQEKNIILQNLEKERQDNIKRIQQKQHEEVIRYNTQDF